MFDNFNNAALIVLGVIAAVYAIIWMGITIWALRDIRRRSNNAFTQLVAVLLVFIFSFIGLLLYLIFRPLQTSEQREEKEIEERIIRSINDIGLCFKCDMEVASNFTYCPHCRAKLKNKCVKCNGLLEDDWTICPYCGTDAPKNEKNKKKKNKKK